MARLIPRKRPEPGGIRRQHLVTQNDLAVLVKPELELGVGDDDPAGQRVVRALLVERDRAVADLRSELLAAAREGLLEDLDALLVADILVVVTDLGLGGRRVDRLRQLVALVEPLRELDPADRAVLLVARPAGAGDVAADDALDRDHGELLHQHAVPVKLRCAEELRHIRRVGRDHVVRQDVLRVVEPELGHLGQDRAFFGDLIFQNDVKCRDAVRCDEDQVLADIVNLTDFAFFYRNVFDHVRLSFLFVKLFRTGCVKITSLV